MLQFRGGELGPGAGDRKEDRVEIRCASASIRGPAKVEQKPILSGDAPRGQAEAAVIGLAARAGASEGAAWLSDSAHVLSIDCSAVPTAGVPLVPGDNVVIDCEDLAPTGRPPNPASIAATTAASASACLPRRPSHSSAKQIISPKRQCPRHRVCTQQGS